MEHKTIICRNDYDLYYLNVPIKNVKIAFYRNRVKQFVLSEIEKIHPFFGIHCNVYWKFLIQNMKLILFVIVMDATLLQEYEKNNANTCLYIHDQEKKIINMRVFKKRKKGVAFFIMLLISLMFVSLGTWFYSESLNQNMHGVENINTALIKNVHDANLPMHMFFSKLNDWLSQGVLCTSFMYINQGHALQSNENQIHIETSLEGLLPEEVYAVDTHKYSLSNRSVYKDAISLSPIHFVNNSPQFTVIFSHTMTENNIVPTRNSFEVKKLMREIIFANGGVIQEENWANDTLSFFVPCNQWSDLFSEIVNYLKSTNQTFESVSLVYDENALTISAQILVKDGQFPLELLVLENLFDNILRKQNVLLLHHREWLEEKKIGNIKKDNGTEIVFYLSADGKIIAKEVP